MYVYTYLDFRFSALKSQAFEFQIVLFNKFESIIKKEQ